MTEAQAKEMWDAAWEEGYKSAVEEIQESYNELVDKYNSLLEDYNALLESNGNDGCEQNYDLQEMKKTLKSIIEIKQSTFDNFGLKLTNYGISNIATNGWVTFALEIEGNTLNEGVFLKMNFYDEDNNLLGNDDSTYISCTDFAGYDSFSLSIHIDNLAFEAKKIVIFLAK